MDEAAAILALAIINSAPTLKDNLWKQSEQSAQAGADFVLPYFIAVRASLEKAKKTDRW